MPWIRDLEKAQNELYIEKGKVSDLTALVEKLQRKHEIDQEELYMLTNRLSLVSKSIEEVIPVILALKQSLDADKLGMCIDDLLGFVHPFDEEG